MPNFTVNTSNFMILCFIIKHFFIVHSKINRLSIKRLCLLGKLSSSTIVGDNVDIDTKGLRFFSNSCTIDREVAMALRHAM